MERTEIKSYTERTWQSAFTRLTDGCRQMTVIYSGHGTRQEAEACACCHAGRYDDVVSIDVTPIDHSYEYEYCGEDVYNGYMWHLDGSFAARPGQEVTPEIYNHMLDCLPPISLPRTPETAGYSAGFLAGEPYDCDPETGRTRYAAFAKRNGHCFFLGYLAA